MKIWITDTGKASSKYIYKMAMSLFVSHLFSFCCLGKDVLHDYGSSCMSTSNISRVESVDPDQFAHRLKLIRDFKVS